MAKTFSMGQTIESKLKTRQGRGQHSKYSATSRKTKKRYRGQGMIRVDMRRFYQKWWMVSN